MTNFKFQVSKEDLEKAVSEGLNIREISEKLGVSPDVTMHRIKFFRINYTTPARKSPPKCTDETKLKISEARKKWLRENPDRHPWRNKDKFQSKPCQKVKDFLTTLKVDFIPEFYPRIPGRYFSIDIALPDKMIALEINGNQHYEKDGRLKPYYQERHDLLEVAGWTVYEIHYSACFDLDKWSSFVDQIKNAEKKVEFDYFNYIPQKEKLKTPKKIQNKINWPSVEEMKELILQNPIKEASQILGVQTPALYAFCKKNNLSEIYKNFWKPNKSQKQCQNCGADKCERARLCYPCYKISSKTRTKWPDPQDFQKLLWEKPRDQIANDLAVSDRAVDRFCHKHNLTKPPRGYWQKKEAGKL